MAGRREREGLATPRSEVNPQPVQVNAPRGFVFGRRRFLASVAGACLLAAVAGVEEVEATEAPSATDGGVASPGRHTSTAEERSLLDPRSFRRVWTTQPLVALTFDDGPDPDYTPHVLDLLADAGARATFFMVGRNATAHPDLVARARREGHVVANHTMDHLFLDALPEAAVATEVDRGQDVLRRLESPSNAWFRPPRGWTSAAVATVTAARGVRSVFWTDCVEAHAHHRMPAAAARAVASAARPGSILLAHDGGTITGPNPQRIDRSFTVETLPVLLRELRRRSLRSVGLTELVTSGLPGFQQE